MSNWRPEEWRNPYTVNPQLKDYPKNAFEQGADAMLEAIKQTGEHYGDIDAPYKTVGVLKQVRESGTIVFIPDKEVNHERKDNRFITSSILRGVLGICS